MKINRVCAKNTALGLLPLPLLAELMYEVRLQIYTPNDSQTVTLNGKLSVGRTNNADLALNDAGLSRVHATFEQHGEEVWLFDENSTNGTFVNGLLVPPDGTKLNHGDEISLGNTTQIIVRLESPKSKVQSPKSEVKPTKQNPQSVIRNPQFAKIPPVLLYAGGGAMLILVLMIGGLVGVRLYENHQANKTNPRNQTAQNTDLPPAVIDPLKGEPDELDDLFSAWEVPDEVEATSLDDVKTTSSDAADPSEASELNVTRAFWEQQKAKAMEQRNASTGITPAGLQVPRELSDGVGRQTLKLREMMQRDNYEQPMDFGDLAEKRIARQLVELPMATKSYLLEVGSSATEEQFNSFAFTDAGADVKPLQPGNPKFNALSQLAGNFAGQKYDMNNGRDRQQMKIRLLRMFHPRSKPILERLANAYYQKFNRPLRVTSLTRSVEYQLSLNKTNPNSYPCRGKGCLPPHTSGCAFDLARKHMTAEEQNFVMGELVRMEKEGILDAIIEYNANACFHVFIYHDGKPAGK